MIYAKASYSMYDLGILVSYPLKYYGRDSFTKTDDGGEILIWEIPATSYIRKGGGIIQIPEDAEPGDHYIEIFYKMSSGASRVYRINYHIRN